MNIPRDPSVENLEAALRELSIDETAEASPAPPSTWPDLLRLFADIWQDAIPLLEGGKKANVFALLLLFSKAQAAWQAVKALRKPADLSHLTVNERRAQAGLPPLE